ncbi:hypothetical protein JVT61DRAFT_10027 [Boletus reticuloceps]|uniref:Uncharacterized protein n=1 Tax=Boletus reticuloceps TaxID=495285 RepID=A0A8I2YYK6_9AGAM|nr:hypothetical protein JVT61DRAFT_10027 [Boletus reticuloceps]
MTFCSYSVSILVAWSRIQFSATRVNQCVALHNERHFVLFIFFFTVLGYQHAIDALRLRYVVRSTICFLLTVTDGRRSAMGSYHAAATSSLS